MRNLVDVIDQLVAVAPELKDCLASVRSSALFAAPEIAYVHWNRAAEILSDNATTHPKADELRRIFAGQ